MGMRLRWPSGWAGDAGLLMAGTVAGQVVPLLLQPWLRRTFSAEDFGAFSVYFSLCSILSVSSSLRFEMGITSAADDNEAVRLHALSQWVNVGVGLLLALLLPLAFVPALNAAIGPGLMPWLWTIPPSVVLMGSFRNLNMLLLRQKLFALSAWNKVNRRGAEGAVQLGGGLAGMPGTLILADLAGHVLNNLSAYLRLRHLFHRPSATLQQLKEVAREYGALARLNALPSVLNTFCLMFPAIIIQRHFGDAATGQYDLSRFVLAVPLALVGAAAGQVVLQRTGELRRQMPQLMRFYRQVASVLGILAVVMAVVVMLFSQPLFSFFFGDGWELAAQMSAVLAMAYALKLVVSPMSSALIGLGRLRPVAYWQWSYTLFVIGLWLWPTDDTGRFFYIFAAGESLLYLAYAGIIIHQIKEENSVTPA